MLAIDEMPRPLPLSVCLHPHPHPLAGCCSRLRRSSPASCPSPTSSAAGSRQALVLCLGGEGVGTGVEVARDWGNVVQGVARAGGGST